MTDELSKTDVLLKNLMAGLGSGVRMTFSASPLQRSSGAGAGAHAGATPHIVSAGGAHGAAGGSAFGFVAMEASPPKTQMKAKRLGDAAQAKGDKKVAETTKAEVM